MSFSIRNSAAFYFSDASNNHDWTAPQNGDLWRDGVKTLWDPCPAGWRVPLGGTGNRSPWNAFTVSNGPWQGTGNTAGRLFPVPEVYGGSAWVPVPGRRELGTGLNSSPGIIGFQWATGVSSSGIAFYISISLVRPYDTNGRAYGHSVRCVRL